MPRWVLVAAVAVGVLALFASSSFALARSWQLQRSHDRVAELESELSEVRDRVQGQAAEPEAEPEEPDEDQPSSPLDDLFDEFDDDSGLDDLFGEDQMALAQCLQSGPGPNTFDVPDGNAEDQIDTIADAVEQLRGLEFEQRLEPQFLSRDEITKRVADEINEEYSAEQADADRRILGALGAIAPDLNLREFQAEFVSGQVAGFYDPDTEELVVQSGQESGSLSPTEQVTLAHELDHALTDQRLGLPIDATEDDEDADRALAALSVIEGDATLAMQQYAMGAFTLEEQLQLNLDPDALDAQRQLQEAPHYLVQGLQFPYVAGLGFVCDAHGSGGWSAVDDLYGELPATTAEIMDPARHGTPPDNPAEPAEPDGPWEQAYTTTLGAAQLQWMFEAPGDDSSEGFENARERALEWAGGSVWLWTDDDRSAVAVRLTQQESGGQLCDTVAEWYQRAFPEATDAGAAGDERLAVEDSAQAAALTCPGDEVRLGIGPDFETARALLP